MLKLFNTSWLTIPLIFSTLPSTTHYMLNSYGFGSGGGPSSTSNYSIEGISGELSGGTTSTANYAVKPGFIQVQQANVPKITLSNPSTYYDKLKFVIDAQGNPTDALYALQVQKITSSCDFASNVFYVQPDDTLSSSLVITDYQTYSAWGGASGQNMIGLVGNTSYCIRAKATQSTYTESAYGPSSTAATSPQSITFCLYTNANCGAGGSSENFSRIVPGASPTNSPTNVGVDLTTNANNGAYVWISSAWGGIKSTNASYQINSATTDLSSAAQGYGARVASVTSLTKVSPYDLSGNNVGALSTTLTTILNASGPVSGGTAAIQLQLKADKTTPPATDYGDTLTVVAAANF